jgi:hypothetical protein
MAVWVLVSVIGTFKANWSLPGHWFYLLRRI